MSLASPPDTTTVLARVVVTLVSQPLAVFVLSWVPCFENHQEGLGGLIEAGEPLRTVKCIEL
jgi:hypothetical protein